MSQALLLQIVLAFFCFEVLVKCVCLAVGAYPRQVPAWSDALDVLLLIPFITYIVLALT